MALGTAGAIGAGLGLAGLGGSIYGQVRQADEIEKARRESRGVSAEALKRQVESLEKMRAPEQSPLQQARLRALEQESQMGPVSQDPLFQAERARLLRGGAQELSAIQNLQRATGTRGGFRNIGSLQDVEDRLGVAMTELAQRSRTEKERKRDLAAELQQGYYNAWNDFQNARQQAYQAFVGGDAAAGVAALQAASAARQQMLQNQTALSGQLLGIGGAIAGGALQQQPRQVQQQPRYAQGTIA